MNPRLAAIAIMLLGLMIAPGGAHELNQRDHPDPATAARAAQRSALAQRLSKQKLIILDSGLFGCTSGDIVILEGARRGLRTTGPGTIVVPALCR
jgi:hypothetical protein